jgi:hypothetical protein
MHNKANFEVSNAANAFSMLLHQSNEHTDSSRTLCRHPLLHPLFDVRLRLLHRVELPVPCHFAVVLAVLVVQPLKPLAFSITLFPRCLPDAIPRGLFQLTNHWVLCLILPPLRHHSKPVPLDIVVAIFKLVQRVVERVELRLCLAGDTQDSAGLRVALDLDLFDIDSLCGLLGDDVQAVCRAVGAGVGARGLGVIEAEKFDCLFCTTCCVVEARCETETAVIL